MKHLATLAHRCHPATSAMSTALRCAPIHGAPASNPQRGIALVFVLLMLAVAMGLALITARMTLMGDKASRNDRDRQIAFQAAELALNDAELEASGEEKYVRMLSLAEGSLSEAGFADWLRQRLRLAAGDAVHEPKRRYGR